MRLTVADLDCQRSGRPVLSGVSFQLNGGEALVLTGSNGAGKSSLLLMLAGLLDPAGGRMELEGHGTEYSLPELAHYVGHRDALKPALTPLESLEFWQAMLGSPNLTPASALKRMSLDHAADLPSAYLSAGQRRRLALARLLVSRRMLWLLDEPTSALDAASQETFAGLVAEHLAGGGMVVAATHIPLGIADAMTLRMGEAA